MFCRELKKAKQTPVPKQPMMPPPEHILIGYAQLKQQQEFFHTQQQNIKVEIQSEPDSSTSDEQSQVGVSTVKDLRQTRNRKTEKNKKRKTRRRLQKKKHKRHTATKHKTERKEEIREEGYCIWLLASCPNLLLFWWGWCGSLVEWYSEYLGAGQQVGDSRKLWCAGQMLHRAGG